MKTLILTYVLSAGFVFLSLWQLAFISYITAASRFKTRRKKWETPLLLRIGWICSFFTVMFILIAAAKCVQAEVLPAYFFLCWAGLLIISYVVSSCVEIKNKIQITEEISEYPIKFLAFGSLTPFIVPLTLIISPWMVYEFIYSRSMQKKFQIDLRRQPKKSMAAKHPPVSLSIFITILGLAVILLEIFHLLNERISLLSVIFGALLVLFGIAAAVYKQKGKKD